MALGFLWSPGFAQSAGAGVVEGRVFNAATGTYLHNARIKLAGTNAETSTNENGEYRLANVPAGSATLTINYTGFESETVTLAIPSGGAVRKDIELMLGGQRSSRAGETVKLESFTVAERRLSGQALALNEQRSAPNVMNVVSVDEFPSVGEANVGELLQFVPGLSLMYNPQSPSQATMRGMPASGTIVTVDGAELASTLPTTRSFDFANAGTGTIDRIEITKVPTPDMPANAVGGGINMISKSGFSRRTPLLTYKLFATYTANRGLDQLGSPFQRVNGIDDRTTVTRTQPGIDLSYILPLNPSLAFTFAASKSVRYNDWENLRTTWDKVRGVQTGGSGTFTPLREDKDLLQAGVDWKLGGQHTFSVNGRYARQIVSLRQNSFLHALGAGTTGDATFSQGAATGVGTVSQAFGSNNQYKPLSSLLLRYQFSGGPLKVNADATWSTGSIKFLDMSDGFFANLGVNITTLVVRAEGLRGLLEQKIDQISAVDRSGARINIFDGNNYSLNSSSSNERYITDEIRKGGLNAAYDFGTRIPLTVKMGAAVSQRINNAKGESKSWTFTPPGGIPGRQVRNFDLMADNFSNQASYTDTANNPVNIRYVSITKVLQLYREHPEWFILNEAAAFTAAATAKLQIKETISAAYFRGDLKFFENRLWLVGGVRFEKTDDDGRGASNNPGNLYVRDANGRIVLDGAGRPTFITNDLLQRARLQYEALGARSERSYQGYYPSLNSSYSITDKIIARAAYARTIGRPNFNEIIPGITVVDPGSATADKTLTIINTGLRAWTSDNYDLSFEAYNVKGAVASVSFFRKDLKDFFGLSRIPVTPEILAQYGLSDDYLSYDVVTKENKGAASIEGVEAGYRQSLFFLPHWARGLQVFVNWTRVSVSGANADDLTEVTPTTYNWGLNFVRPRYAIKVGVMERRGTRVSPAAASATVRANSYARIEPQGKVDVSMEYKLTRRLYLEGSVRNLWNEGLRRGTWSPDTPDYARVDQAQFTGALVSLGIKGEF